MKKNFRKALKITFISLLIILPLSLLYPLENYASGDQWLWLYGYVHYRNETGSEASGVSVIAHNLNTGASLSNITDSKGGFEWLVSSNSEWRHGDKILIVAEKDEWNGYKNWSGKAYIVLNFTKPYQGCNIILNLPPPDVPDEPVGPTQGGIGANLTYNTSTTDINNFSIQYEWDWNGDGVGDEITKWYESGEICSISHKWNNEGVYNISVRAKNEEGQVSNWSSTLSVTILNHPPATPHTPFPVNDATDVALTATLSWQCSDPDGDDLTYDIYFGTSSPPTKIEDNITSANYNPSLQYSTIYYWRIVAWDAHGAKTISPIWHFTTIPQQYTLTTSVDPSGSGSITLNPTGGTYDYGTVVTLTAVANTGYEFDHWSGDASGSNPTIQVTMNENKNIVAHFVAITPNQPPTVAITFPLNASKVSGIIAIQGKANDTDGAVEKVEIKIDNGAWNVATGTTSWSYSWNTTLVSNGNHTIYAKAYDGTDYSKIVSVAIIVNNIQPNHKPNVNIIFPLNGAVVKGIITIHGTASDEDGDESITKVEIKIGNGGWVIVNGITKWNYSWDTTSIENGDYVIQARAYDGYEYSSIDSIMVKVSNKNSTPGFGFVSLVGALAMIFLLSILKRKKQKWN